VVSRSMFTSTSRSDQHNRAELAGAKRVRKGRERAPTNVATCSRIDTYASSDSTTHCAQGLCKTSAH
jgi:hypothetical protein